MPLTRQSFRIDAWLDGQRIRCSVKSEPARPSEVTEEKPQLGLDECLTACCLHNELTSTGTSTKQTRDRAITEQRGEPGNEPGLNHLAAQGCVEGQVE